MSSKIGIFDIVLDKQIEDLLKNFSALNFSKQQIELRKYNNRNLPDAKKLEGCLIYNIDTKKVMYSDGIKWVNLEGR